MGQGHAALERPLRASANPRRSLSALSHLDRTLILPVWLVYVYVVRRADGELAGVLVERDGLELGFFVDVGCL